MCEAWVALCINAKQSSTSPNGEFADLFALGCLSSDGRHRQEDAMALNLKSWRYRHGLTQQQTAWLLGLTVAGIRRLDAGVEQLAADDVAWLQDYARIRDQAREVPEVQVRVGRWH